MLLKKLSKANETELFSLSSNKDQKKDLEYNPPLLDKTLFVQEDPTSLWQYCIHEKDKINHFDLLFTMIFGIFYFFCFYAVIIYLLNHPIHQFIHKASFPLWMAKIFFVVFLFVQSELECLDGWRMLKFAQGTRKTIVAVGFLQYFFGSLVEIISYSLINRSVTILEIMTNATFLAVFLRMDDIFVDFIRKMFPIKKKKVIYDKVSFEIDSRKELYLALFIKISYFCIAEIGLVGFETRLFL